jgi:hypothetical protein
MTPREGVAGAGLQEPLEAHRYPFGAELDADIDGPRPPLGRRVEGRPAFQRDPRFEERVAVKSVEESEQAKDLLEGLRFESGGGRFVRHDRLSTVAVVLDNATTPLGQ